MLTEDGPITQDGPTGQRSADVQLDVSTLKGTPRGADAMVYTVALRGSLSERWIEGYRMTIARSAVSRRFELDPAARTVRFACRTADGTPLVFEMLERLEAMLVQVNRLAEIWRSHAPRVVLSPSPLRAR